MERRHPAQDSYKKREILKGLEEPEITSITRLVWFQFFAEDAETSIGYRFNNRAFLIPIFFSEYQDSISQHHLTQLLENTGDNIIEEEVRSMFPKPGEVLGFLNSNVYLSVATMQVYPKIQSLMHLRASAARAQIHKNSYFSTPRILANTIEMVVGAVFYDSKNNIDAKNICKKLLSTDLAGDVALVLNQNYPKEQRQLVFYEITRGKFSLEINNDNVSVTKNETNDTVMETPISGSGVMLVKFLLNNFWCLFGWDGPGSLIIPAYQPKHKMFNI